MLLVALADEERQAEASGYDDHPDRHDLFHRDRARAKLHRQEVQRWAPGPGRRGQGQHGGSLVLLRQLGDQCARRGLEGRLRHRGAEVRERRGREEVRRVVSRNPERADVRPVEQTKRRGYLVRELLTVLDGYGATQLDPALGQAHEISRATGSVRPQNYDDLPRAARNAY